MVETNQPAADNIPRLRRHVNRVAARIFAIVAECFPVAAASDEFGFFPQVIDPLTRWDSWDRFTAEGIQDAVGRLQAEALEMKQLQVRAEAAGQQFSDVRIDSSMVLECVETLIAQLTTVRAWEVQPTWHLTIVCVGLAEALASENPRALSRRAAGLTAYIDRATAALKNVPVLFRDLGLEMVIGTRDFLACLQSKLPDLASAQQALDRLEVELTTLSAHSRYQLPRDLFEQVVEAHLQLRFDCRDLEMLLDQEIREMRQLLGEIAGTPLTAAGLERAIRRLPQPAAPDGNLLHLYEREVSRLARHCVAKNLVSEEVVANCPVRVAPVPAYLSPIRAASSYSIPARHPPTGGVFYVINATQPAELHKRYQREYRMLIAHETYPGHHMLDVHRWGLSHPIRRAIERPLFYEGWACFAEEIIRMTGYLHTQQDRLLLARRRLWRAIRGKVDLGLQTGQLDLASAAQRLTETGINPQDALSAVRKYPLNPGYQSCYTAGIRRFLDLYDRYGGIGLPAFVATVLGQGEIGFEYLEKVLGEDRKHRSGPDLD